MWRGIGFEVQGTGVPVVFLHGMGGDRRLWRSITAAMKEDRVQTILIDLPGHGDSREAVVDGPAATPYADRVAIMLSQLIDELGAADPVLVGHSLGGAIATFIASGGRVRGVLNIDQDLRLAVLANALLPRSQTIQHQFPKFWAEMLNGFGLEALPVEEWNAVLRCREPDSDTVLRYWDILLSGNAEAAQFFAEKKLRAITAPYTVMLGKDRDSEHDRWLRGLLPQAHIVPYSGGKHYVHLVHPQKTVALIRGLVLAESDGPTR